PEVCRGPTPIGLPLAGVAEPRSLPRPIAVAVAGRSHRLTSALLVDRGSPWPPSSGTVPHTTPVRDFRTPNGPLALGVVVGTSPLCGHLAGRGWGTMALRPVRRTGPVNGKNISRTGHVGLSGRATPSGASLRRRTRARGATYF